jgi:Lamin-B receptor of TUDOR domain
LLPTQTSDLSLYAIGTKVAKRFEGDLGELVWFEGVVQRFDEASDLYWVLYSDGDSEDMDTDEVRDAVQNYRVHMQKGVSADAEIDAADSSPSDTSAGVNNTTLVVEPAAVTTVANNRSSELAVAMQAMTAAAEQLAAAAARIEAAVQTQQLQQPQQLQHQQQQQMPTVQPLLLHQHWQQVMIQQHQQQRLACYQQQQMLYWRQMFDFKQQCRR